MRFLLLASLLCAAPVGAQTWNPTSPLPDGYNGHALVASGGFLYNIGGLSLTNGALDGMRVFSGQIQSDGGVAPWKETTDLPVAVFYHAGVAARGFVYVLGGYHYDAANGLAVSDGVFYAKQNADGTLGPWQSGPPLPTTLFYLSAAYFNGRIYATGGWDGSQLSSQVYSAVVNADGSLGPWLTQRPLPEGVYTHAAVSDGMLYILGGVVNGGTEIENTVYAAPINPDGTLGDWVMDNPLPIPVSNHGAAVANGRVYVLGGWDGTQQRAEVYSATSGQTLGSWTSEPALPKALEKHGVAVWNSRLYVSGGNDPVETQAGVYWRDLPPPPKPTDVLPPRTTLTVGQPQWGQFLSPATPLALSAVDDLTTVGDGAGLGVAATYWAVDGGSATAYAAPFSIAAEGAHWLQYYSVDTTGNVEAVHTASAAVDATPPVSSLSAGAPQETLGGGSLVVSSYTLLSASAADPVSAGVASGVSTLTVTVDGAAVDASRPFALPDVDGPHSVVLRAVDNVGNAEAARTETVYVHTTDPVTTLTPTTTAYYPSDGGAPILGAAAALAFSANDPAAGGVAAGVNRTEYSLDSAPVAVATCTLVLAPGSHNVAFRSVDNVGNAEGWKSASYRVDAQAPVTTFAIGSPVMMVGATPVVTPDTPLSLSASDDLSGVKTTLYALDGGADQAYAGPFHLSVGSHTVTYGSVDNAGNAEPRRSVTLAVQADDTLPPRTTLSWLGGRSGVFVSSRASAALSAVDDLSAVGDGLGVGVGAVDWSLDDAPFSVYAGTASFAEGAHWLRYYAVDLAGNAESVHVSSFSVDGTAPVSTLAVGAPQAALADGRLVVSSSTLLSLSASDPVSNGAASGVAALSLSVDGAARDASAAFTLPAADGAHALSYQALDAVGNAEPAHAATIWVDQTAPETTLTPTTTAYAAADGGAPWLGASAALVFSAQDPAVGGVAAGVNRTEYSLDGASVVLATSSLVLAQGAHTIAFRSVDDVGNAEAWKTASYRVDEAAPLTTFTIGSPVMMLAGTPVITPDTPLSLTAADDYSGVRATVYSLDGGADQAYSGSFHLAIGAHTLSFGSTDNAGNVEPRRTVALTVQADDTLPPRTTLSWLGSRSGAFVSAASAARLTSVDDLAAVGDGKGVGVAAISWSLDSAPFSVYAGTASFAEGAHWLRYYAADLAGNTEAVNVTSFSVDGTAPLSALDVGAPQATLSSGELVVSSTTLLSASAADPVSNGVASGVASLSATVDGRAVDASAPFALPPADGPHAVVLQAADAVGNAEAARSRTIYVDASAPQTTAIPTSPAVAASDGGAPWLGASAALAFTAQDPVVGGIASGVNRTEYALDGGAAAAAGATVVLPEGAHTAAYRSVDDVGNAEAWKSVSYRVDATAPQTTLSLGSPTSLLFGSPLVTAQTPLALSATDPVSAGVASGVKTIVYSLDGGADQAYAGPFTLSAGNHTLSYGARDIAGNAEPRHAVSVAVGTFLQDAAAAGESITVSGGASIAGDARAPRVTVNGKGTISGRTLEQEPVEAVDLDAARAFAQADNDDASVPQDALSGGALTLASKRALTLPGGVYYFTGLSVSGQAALSFSGPAQVFVAGDVSVSGGGTLNASGAADGLWLFSSGESVSVAGKGRAAFNLYAPEASASFSGGGAVAGRLYAKTLALSGNAVQPSTTALPAQTLPPGQAKKLDRPEPREAAEASAEVDGSSRRVASARTDSEAPKAPSAKSAASAGEPAARAEDLPAAAPAPKGVSQSSQTYASVSAFRPERPRPQALAALSGDAASARTRREDPPAPSRGGPAAAAPALELARLPAPAARSRVAQSSQTYAGAAAAAPRPAPQPLALQAPLVAGASAALSSALTASAAPAPPALGAPAAAWSAAPKGRPGRPVIRRPFHMSAPPVVAAAPKAAFSLVDAQGSAVRASGGEAVVVPPGAVASGLNVTVNAVASTDAALERRQDAARSRLGLVPAGEPVQFGPEGTKFAKPVTIELPFDKSLLAAGVPLQDLVVEYWNPNTSAWEAMPSAVDAQAGVVRAQTSHFSLYQVHATTTAVAGAAPSSSGGALAFQQVYAYPDPARHGARPTIHADVSGADHVDVSVYDLGGALLQQGSAAVSGGAAEYAVDTARLGSGVYLYVVKASAPGQGQIRRSGRLAVIK